MAVKLVLTTTEKAVVRAMVLRQATTTDRTLAIIAAKLRRKLKDQLKAMKAVEQAKEATKAMKAKQTMKAMKPPLAPPL